MVGPRRQSPRLVLVLLAAAGCEQADPGPALPLPPVAPARSAWRTDEDGPTVAVPPEDAELAAAVERARATVQEARTRWLASSGDDRERWGIKWAAPTADGTIEHLWVVPVTWTRFRVEGRLANQPQRELECGRNAGELVSFPADELSDWVHFLQGRADGPREGGFTMELLERRYGRPH